MAETSSKRQREETHVEDCEDPKRYKSYNHILSILEDEEDESNQDLSSFLSTLQQELSFDSIATVDPLPCPTSEAETHNCAVGSTASDYSPVSSSHVLKEEDGERVMRHLLEASDDELGIPHRTDGGGGGGDDDRDVINGGDHAFAFSDGLWEFEDHEAANYYALLQSELFM
ncbi:uncharacterized protein LOC132304796 [Cornus florida]|uniref:uncharacterized protein LOC132304796 n=1 Tax=Cornus florida TaxID=4283 RepID=UPI002898A37A|nr:uncharacterized protein LOC132304796 [Cornus florida]